jgi:hypothetical protein
MSDKLDRAVRSGAAPFLHPSEQVLATLIASVRGHQQAMSGGIAGMTGGARAGRARSLADAAGITLTSPMALVLTPRRLLTLETGNGGKVERLLNEFSVAEVGEMKVKRVGLGASVTITVTGVELRLESRVAASRQFAEILAQARAVAGVDD